MVRSGHSIVAEWQSRRGHTVFQEQLGIAGGQGGRDIGALEDCILHLFSALVAEFFDQLRHEEGGVF